MVDIKIRCGEVYSFNMIKSITDLNNGTIEVVGNFKPRGRHHNVILWKPSILNLNEIEDIYDIKENPYFCLKCKKNHHSGKIYYEHKEHIGKKDDLIPTDRIIEADLTNMREVADRQLERLLKRRELNPNRFELYTKRINELILYEGVNKEEIF